MSPVVLVLFKTAFTALDQQPLCFLTLFQTLTICLKSPFQHILPLLPMHDTDSEKMDKNFLSFFPLHLQTFLYLSPSFPPLPSERKMSLFFSKLILLIISSLGLGYFPVSFQRFLHPTLLQPLP